MSQFSSSNLSQYSLHRAASTVVRTFAMVLVGGITLSFLSHPRYQSSVKLFLESGNEQQPVVDASNPLSGLVGVQLHTIANQVEIMKGEKIISDACKDADIPMDGVTMIIQQISGTNVVEVAAISSTPSYAERYAKTFPNTYLGYVTDNSRTEVSNAYAFATRQLAEEDDKLAQAELAQQRFTDANFASASTPDYARKMREMQREIDLHRGPVETLTSAVNDLRLRSHSTHDPIMVITPAQAAVQISPSFSRYVLGSAVVGLLLGVLAAGMQIIVLGQKRA